MNSSSSTACVEVRCLLWIVLAILVAAGSGCGSNSSGTIDPPAPTAVPFDADNSILRGRSGPPAPTPLKPGDDPAYDWEAPGHPQSINSGSWSYAIKPDFAASRTLEQTTPWLKWAIETYGTKESIPDTFKISGVKFSGCTMQWDEKRFINNGDSINKTIYTLNLADVDIAYEALKADEETVSLGDNSGLSNPKFQKLEKFWEKDGSTMKSRGDRTSADSTAVIPVQVKDDISRRIGWAMVHAVRLCGGKPSR